MPLLSEGWNRKCLTAVRSLTDMRLVYEIPLCLQRQSSAGQTCPCLCLAITSRKLELGGCFCGCPVQWGAACLLLQGLSWKGWHRAFSALTTQTPLQRASCSLQRSQLQASARTPPSQGGLGSCHVPQLFYLLLHKQPGRIRARIYPLLITASIYLFCLQRAEPLCFSTQRAFIHSAVKMTLKRTAQCKTSNCPKPGPHEKPQYIVLSMLGIRKMWVMQQKASHWLKIKTMLRFFSGIFRLWVKLSDLCDGWELSLNGIQCFLDKLCSSGS